MYFVQSVKLKVHFGSRYVIFIVNSMIVSFVNNNEAEI